MKAAARILATFFGVGLFPLAPGTLASAIVVLAYRFALHDLAWPLYILLLAVLFFAGTAASALCAAELGRPDPGQIVVDEVCGQLAALALMPSGWIALAVSFAFLRPEFSVRVQALPALWQKSETAHNSSASLSSSAGPKMLSASSLCFARPAVSVPWNLTFS